MKCGGMEGWRDEGWRGGGMEGFGDGRVMVVS